MCTLSVITRDDGYYLAMNRDERLTRGDALSPAVIRARGVKAMYPRDGAGGTWIGANEHGIALALLNWNDVPQSGAEKIRSRGVVIPALIGCRSLEHAQESLQTLDLRGLWPFRMVGVFPAVHTIIEWHWDAENLTSALHVWEPRHWFSSSMSDEKASAQRGEVCKKAWESEDAGSLSWLRRLHASHAPGPGPFSLCVHREGVGTLSYTEIACGIAKIECRYFEGSPCTMRELGGPVELVRRV